MTPEQLIKDLEECIDKDFYFEISPEDSRILLEYIRELEEFKHNAEGVDIPGPDN